MSDDLWARGTAVESLFGGGSSVSGAHDGRSLVWETADVEVRRHAYNSLVSLIETRAKHAVSEGQMVCGERFTVISSEGLL